MSRSFRMISRRCLPVIVTCLAVTFLTVLAPSSLALAQPALSPDFTADGVIDDRDLLPLIHRLGTERGKAGFELLYDLDQNGRVDAADVLLFQSEWYGTPSPRSPIAAEQLRTQIGLPVLLADSFVTQCAGGTLSQLCGGPGRITAGTPTIVAGTDALPIALDHDGPGGKGQALVTAAGPVALLQIDVTTPSMPDPGTGLRLPLQSVEFTEPIVLAPAAIVSGSTLHQSGAFDVDVELTIEGKALLQTTATADFASAITWLDCSANGDWSLACVQIVLELGVMGFGTTSRSAILFTPEGLQAVDHTVEANGEVLAISFETVPPDVAEFGDLLALYENPTPEQNDYLGWGIGLAGGHVIVGSPFDDERFENAGAAYLFEAATGSLLETFLNRGQEDLSYGDDVGGVGHLIMVASPSEDAGEPRAGRVYVYDGDPDSPTWLEYLFDIPNPDPVAGGFYGAEIESRGNLLAISAYNNEVDGVRAGQVYLYEYNRSNEPLFLTPLLVLENPEPTETDQFGDVVHFLGDGLLGVSGRFDDYGGFDGAGSVHVFDVDPTSAGFGDLLTTLRSPAPFNFEAFGYNFAACGDVIAVCAYYTRQNTGQSVGSVFLFDGDPRSQTFGMLLDEIVNPSENTFVEGFGQGLAGFGNYLAVSSTITRTAGVNDTGSIFFYDCHRDSPTFGVLRMEINNPGDSSGNFGEYILNLNGNVLVTASGYSTTNPPASGAGIVYLFQGPNVP